jgi:glucosamine--fructose-6-phosphate aminotransferase (isomerizing)
MNSMMLDEALEAPLRVAVQLSAALEPVERLAASLRAAPPASLLTIARGSSDHAAAYLAYLVMARLGRLVTSLPMSLVTLHGSRIDCDGLVSLAFSQSGQSPDLIVPTQAFRAQGARTVAFVNAEGSPLAAAAEFAIPLAAGAERSVAATKSFIAQLVAGAMIVAQWQQDAALAAALQRLPEALARAAALRWDAAVASLVDAERLYVVSRGLGLPVALEAALKFKETCGIQAEAFSGAELQHGPMALVEAGFPLLVFAPRGPAQAGLLELASSLQAHGARVFVALPPGPEAAALPDTLPLATTGHKDLDAIAAAQSFYPMVEALARARGRDPDRPPHLAKVTRTH